VSASALAIAPQVFARLPGLRVVVVAAEGIAPRALLVSEILPGHAELAEPVRAALVAGLRELFGAAVTSTVLAAERAA
jgi:hypothetical protein